jgi:hypothetical protein
MLSYRPAWITLALVIDLLNHSMVEVRISVAVLMQAGLDIVHILGGSAKALVV